MTLSQTTLLLQAVSALGISLVTAWATVRMSEKRFRAERLWDRKAMSYERVIEAFHKSKKFSSEHMGAVYPGRGLSDEREKELRQLANDALEEIRRTADAGSFTLSEHAIRILAEYQAESIDDDRIKTWPEILEHDYAVTDK